MAKLTDEQKIYYFDHTNNCPFCKSPDIEADSMQADGPTAYQDVKCNDCYEEWRDIFKMIDVKDA